MSRITNGKTRETGIDAFRALAIFMVVLLHCLPLSVPDQPLWATLVALPARAAVPFFFVASGYFLPRYDHLQPAMFLRPATRLLPAYLFWIPVYIAANSVLDATPYIPGWKALIAGGPGFHLWFLPALGAAMVIVSTGRLLVGDRITAIFCLALALAGLAGGTYHDLLFTTGAAGKGRILSAPLLVLAGALLRTTSPAPQPSRALALFVGSLILMLVEELAIAQSTGRPLTVHDVTVGTFAAGIGAFLLARSLHSPRAVSIMQPLAPIGRASLGIYGVHLLFVWLWAPTIGTATPVQILSTAGLAFATSAALTLGYRHFRRPRARKIATSP
jgi:surface polysaccharide O-acyltransferase-like enzyme